MLARCGAGADAAATLIANAVDLPGSAKVTRVPARELTPDSDLRDRLVTVDVAPLDEGETADALARGLAIAQEFRRRGLIIAATLGLNDRVERVDPVTLIDRKPAHA